MDDNSVWPPTPRHQPPQAEPVARLRLFLWVPLLAVGSGSVLGLLDVCRTDSLADWLTGAMAAVLGFLHPKTFLLSACLLTLCLYVAHVVAILHGIKHPYVEPDVDHAQACWQSLFPNSLGGLIGAVVKVFDQYQPAGDRRS